MKTILTNALTGLLVAWLLFSYAEVLVKNVRPNPQYSSINMFAMLMEVDNNEEQ